MAPPRRRNPSQLGDSWVVDHSDSDGDDEGNEDDSKAGPSTLKSSATIQSEDRDVPRPLPSPKSPRRRSSRAASKTPEPELVMPSIHEDDTEGSWVAANGRSQGDISGKSRRRGSREVTPQKIRARKVEQPQTEKEDKAQSSQAASSTTLSDLANQTLNQSLPVIRPVGSFAMDVFGDVLTNLRKPIAIAIATYLFCGLTMILQNYVYTSIQTALSPICRLPGSSLLNLSMCQAPVSVQYNSHSSPPVEFDQLMNVQSQFEEILEQSAGDVGLPLDMKRGEASIRDLRQVVRFSQLRSKNELVLEFDGFIETARIASFDLQKFNSHVGRGVDNVMATSRWTQRVLDDIAYRDGSRGSIQSFISDRLLAPFQPLKFSEVAVLDQYIQHTRIVEEEINRLIAEAQALRSVLLNLEDRLDVINGITQRDTGHVKGSREDILAKLWTKIGGNRSALSKHEKQLELLQQVRHYQKMALGHVGGTILRLQEMGAELEELRERVGSAELLRDRADIPLSVHIENIQLGCERLERGRNHAKAIENEHLRKVLERGKNDDMRLIDQ